MLVSEKYKITALAGGAADRNSFGPGREHSTCALSHFRRLEKATTDSPQRLHAVRPQPRSSAKPPCADDRELACFSALILSCTLHDPLCMR